MLVTVVKVVGSVSFYYIAKIHKSVRRDMFGTRSILLGAQAIDRACADCEPKHNASEGPTELASTSKLSRRVGFQAQPFHGLMPQADCIDVHDAWRWA